MLKRCSRFPLFWLLDMRAFPFALLGYLLMMTAFAANYGPIATFLAELFGTKVRYSGLSISYMLSGLLGSAGAANHHNSVALRDEERLIGCVVHDRLGGVYPRAHCCCWRKRSRRKSLQTQRHAAPMPTHGPFLIA